jgi:hypothetical protein
MSTRLVALVLAGWCAAAVVAVRGGALATAPPPVVVIALAALTVFVSLALPGPRRWIGQVDLRLLLLPHLVRFVGLAFLILVGRGVLAPEFAAIGWGDLIAALGAVALLAVRAPGPRSGRWWGWLAWNVFGLTDMAFLIATGIRLASAAPEAFTLFRHLPFGLLPTYAVPLIIATHVLIFVRLFNMTTARRAPQVGEAQGR